MVQCLALMRKGEQTMPASNDVIKKIAIINSPDYGRGFSGIEIESDYDRTNPLAVATEDVTESMVVGVLLIVVILFMFPLFNMSGADCELFRSIVETCAFRLAAARVSTMTLTRVLCMPFLERFRPAHQNPLVRLVKDRYIFQLAISPTQNSSNLTAPSHPKNCQENKGTPQCRCYW